MDDKIQKWSIRAYTVVLEILLLKHFSIFDFNTDHLLNSICLRKYKN